MCPRVTGGSRYISSPNFENCCQRKAVQSSAQATCGLWPYTMMSGPWQKETRNSINSTSGLCNLVNCSAVPKVSTRSVALSRVSYLRDARSRAIITTASRRLARRFVFLPVGLHVFAGSLLSIVCNMSQIIDPANPGVLYRATRNFWSLFYQEGVFPTHCLRSTHCLRLTCAKRAQRAR